MSFIKPIKHHQTLRSCLVTKHNGRKGGNCATSSFTKAVDTRPVCPGTNMEMSSATVVQPGGH